MPNDKSPRELAVGRWLRLMARGRWEYVERLKRRGSRGAVAILATTATGEVIIIEQWRAAFDAWVLELPAGLVGDEAGQESESLLAAARRELLEETGYVSETWRELFSGAPSAGLSGEMVTLFRAIDCRMIGAGGGDETESIRVHTRPASTLGLWLAERAAVQPVDFKLWSAAALLTADRAPAARASSSG